MKLMPRRSLRNISIWHKREAAEEQQTYGFTFGHGHERSSLSGLGHTDNACKTFPQKGSTALLGLPKTTLLKNVFNLGF